MKERLGSSHLHIRSSSAWRIAFSGGAPWVGVPWGVSPASPPEAEAIEASQIMIFVRSRSRPFGRWERPAVALELLLLRRRDLAVLRVAHGKAIVALAALAIIVGPPIRRSRRG